MKVSELAKELNLNVLTDGEDKEISGCYVGDLLSLAMSHLEQGSIWITVQTNINTVAVSSLADAACIILPEALEPDEDTKTRATLEGINILSSELTAYELCAEIKGVLS